MTVRSERQKDVSYDETSQNTQKSALIMKQKYDLKPF